MNRVMRSRKLMSTTAVLALTLALLASGGLGTLPATGADRVPVETEPALLSMEDGARVDADAPVTSPPIAEQATKEWPYAPQNSASLDTWFSEIDVMLADKPVLLFFYADWCHYCHEQMPIIDELEQEYTGRLGFVTIDVDERPDYAEEFDVSALPTMFIVYDKQDGQYVKQEISGFVDKETLRQGLDYVIRNGSLPEEWMGNLEEVSDSEDDIHTYSGNSEALPGSSVSTTQEFTFTFQNGGRILTSDGDIFCRLPDEDADGIYDVWENEAANQLRPYVVLGEWEEWLFQFEHYVVNFVRVAPISDGETEYILFFYVVTWSKDYGRYCPPGIDLDLFGWLCQGHLGDTERIIMAWQVLDGHTIQLKYVYTSAHEGTDSDHSGVWDAYGESCNKGKVVAGPDQTLCAGLKFQNNRLVVRASEDKHAIYPSTAVCEHVKLVGLWVGSIGEDCGGGGRLGMDYPFPVYNVGEPGHHLIDDLDDPETPYYTELHAMFPGEKIWSADKFCGGLESLILKCCPSVGEKLNAPDRLLKEMGFYGIEYEEDHLCQLRVRNYDTQEDFDTIQEAIDDSDTKDGHTIHIYPGTYVENVDVTKSVTIRSLWANPDYCVVQAADPYDHVFEVKSDQVNIRGITVTGATGSSAGIYVHGVGYCHLWDNIASDNYWGILLQESSGNSVLSNTANSNTGDGIYLEGSSDNTLYTNVANLNGGAGIRLSDSDNNRLAGNSARDNNIGMRLENSIHNDIASNTADFNTHEGIGLQTWSDDNRLAGNTAVGNDHGIYLADSDNNVLNHNNASYNNYDGIGLFWGSGNTLSENTCYRNNEYGVALGGSDGNTITGGTVNSNHNYGIHLFRSSNNLIYNNWFDNGFNAWDDGTNTWNITKQDGPNIVLGPYLGGNYWSDYEGEDTDSPPDGLGNTPYNSSGNIMNGGDYLPLLPYIRILDTGKAYKSISEAVSASYPGQTIVLGPGIYRENVVVTKSVTITGISGNPEDTIVWAPKSDTHVFNVTANYVTISNLSICGESAFSGNYRAGIYLAPGTSHCTLENNRCGWDEVHRNHYGIWLDSSNNNMILGNTCNENPGGGIRLDSSNNNMILGNTCNQNPGGGIRLASSDENAISDNTCLDGGTGINLWDSSQNTLSDNICSSECAGIALGSSDHNRLLGNTCSDNHFCGEWGGYGIDLYSSPWNTILSNTCLDNDSGIRLLYSSQNDIYLNDFNNNTINADSEGSINTWNSPDTVAYLYDEQSYTNYLGNHWSDYTGADADWDGIGDTPYAIDSDADTYPLVQPLENYEIGSNSPPNAPSNLSPANHATGVSVNTYLTWTGGDPDADDVVDYDVYFGASSTPPFRETIGPCPAEESLITYDPGMLAGGTTYYWQIVTRGMYGTSREGPVQYFTTGDASEEHISVVLQGGSRPEEGWEVPIMIRFFSPGADVLTDTPIKQFYLSTTKSDSTATCQCTVAPGAYDITAVSAHTLMNVKRNVVVSTPSTAVDMGTLLEGNANRDIIINISDFGILAVSYMKMEGGPGYDARADFDRNGIINISDFGLLAVNYMKMSPIDVLG